MAKAKPSMKSRDAETTKMAILDAAELEFGKRGLLGARTENIAEGANVTRAMIHYYYDSKEKLYQAVLERALASRIKIAEEMDVYAGTPTNLLEQYIRKLLSDMSRRPNLPLIMLFEGVQNEGRLYRQIAVNSSYGPLRKILERGVQEGIFREMDVTQVAVNIMGMCVFYVVARFNLQHLFERDVLTPELFNAHTEEAVTMMLAGVLKHQPSGNQDCSV